MQIVNAAIRSANTPDKDAFIRTLLEQIVL
jgi:hypothetical protein